MKTNYRCLPIKEKKGKERKKNTSQRTPVSSSSHSEKTVLIMYTEDLIEG